MTFDGRTLTFTTSVDDLGAGIVLLRQSNRRWRIANWAIVIGMGLIGVYLVVDRLFLPGVGLIGAALFAVALIESGWLNGRLVKGGFSHLIGRPVTLSLDDAGLESVVDGSRSTLEWSAVHSILVDRRVLVIALHENASWLIVPLTAFGGADQIAAFRTTIRRHRKHARAARLPETADRPGGA